jgi:hypothetical protein
LMTLSPPDLLVSGISGSRIPEGKSQTSTVPTDPKFHERK